MMKVIAIILFCVGAALAFFAFLNFIFSVMISRPAKTAKAIGFLSESKTRKNVVLRGRKGKFIGFLKFFTKTKYRFTVRGKSYIARGEHYGPRGDSKPTEEVTYLKACPRICYAGTGSGDLRFLVNGFVLVFVAALCVAFGIVFLKFI